MSQIIQALKEIKQLPYYKNEAAGSGLGHKYARHEEAISSVLEANNFTRKILPLNPHTGRRFSYPLVKKKALDGPSRRMYNFGYRSVY